jgi:hypothetical protein
MYFYTMQVLFLLVVDSTIICFISSYSLLTYIPLPLLVFSPGFIIHMFFLMPLSTYVSGFSPLSLLSVLALFYFLISSSSFI